MATLDIINKLPESFEKALKSGDLLYFPSTKLTHKELDIDFEILLCPTLAEKPIPSQNTTRNLKNDPFEPPYNENLYLGELIPEDEDPDDGYVVLLNKYSLVPHHFLLVTKKYISQNSPLLPPDILTAYQLLIAARDSGKHCIAFYNCGEHSGSSQPHKHVQFIPISSDGPPLERLTKAQKIEFQDKPFALSKLPYANHIYRFPPYFSASPTNEIKAILSRAFILLLDLVVSSMRHNLDVPVGPPSYNAILTLGHLYLIPRGKKNSTLPGTGDRISVNSLGYAGYLLARSEKELEGIKLTGIMGILADTGLTNVHDLQIAGSVA